MPMTVIADVVIATSVILFCVIRVVIIGAGDTVVIERSIVYSGVAFAIIITVAIGIIFSFGISIATGICITSVGMAIACA